MLELHKTKKPLKYDRVDKAVSNWFTEASRENLPIAGTIIKEKAKRFAIKIGETDFAASIGWLDKVKKEMALFKKQYLERVPHLIKKTGKKCHGGKHSKERETCVIAPNISGKRNKPRCLRGVKSLPVKYRGNKKSWMVTDFFEDWGKEWGKQRDEEISLSVASDEVESISDNEVDADAALVEGLTVQLKQGP
ncbi:tigger transposable element-derived protein 4-like [Eupeodes corollae]|uniref:tigger transposable element-derived protein 4-like n=1 Tax=Eupeodes corollae TaxID=290404 RepID=UPI002491A7C8|nr:tigger transposable element-derived protein 4-like [Eupeodes corollae]